MRGYFGVSAMRGKLLLAALVAAAGLLTAPVQATVLYDNLGAASGGADPVADGTAGPLYDSFSTGAGSFSFSHLQLVIGLGGASPNSSLDVALYNDNGLIPGTLNTDIATISDSSLSSTLGVVSLYFPAITLDATTRYWIGLSSPDSASTWSWAVDNSGTGVSGEYYANAFGVSANGDLPFPVCFILGFACGGQPYQMRVSDETLSATPIPAVLPLFATGLGALGVVGWRRKRKARTAA
jgi:hypothetical protein